MKDQMDALIQLLSDAGTVLAAVEYGAEAGACPECSGAPHMPVCRLRDVLASLSEVLAALPPSPQGWQPIETAPKDGTKILAYTVHGDFELTEWYRVVSDRFEAVEGGLYRKHEDIFSQGWNGNTPTHWMPLPPLPAPPVAGDRPLQEDHEDQVARSSPSTQTDAGDLASTLMVMPASSPDEEIARLQGSLAISKRNFENARDWLEKADRRIAVLEAENARLRHSK